MQSLAETVLYNHLLEWGLSRNIVAVWPRFDLWHGCCFNVGSLSTTQALH